MGSVSQIELGDHKSTRPADERYLGKPQEPQEIIKGIIREAQLGVFCGYYGIGKTPLLQDLAFHVCNGLPWLGRSVSQRDVVLLDFESPHFDYVRNISGLQLRYESAQRPKAHLLSATKENLGVTPLEGMLHQKWWERLNFVQSIVRHSPEALIIIDPAEHFFHFNRDRSSHVLMLFHQLREMLTRFPCSAILLVMNLRRRGRRRNPPRLHMEPLSWLEDNAGTLDILNRCDVRLGFDVHDDPALWVIHGARRGETMRPIIVKQIGTPAHWRGFEQVQFASEMTLTQKQREYWRRLPQKFFFEDVVAVDLVPRSSLSRLINRARSLGLLESVEGEHRKT